MSVQSYVTPHGRVACKAADDAANEAATLGDEATNAIRSAFDASSANGLLLLAGPAVRTHLTPDFLFWREFARRFFQALCQLDQEQVAQFTAWATEDDADKDRESQQSIVVPPDDLALAVLISEAPPMHGLEYLTPVVLKRLWNELAMLVCQRASGTQGGLPALLREVNPWWHLLGRVTFHLAENKRNPDRPFAFLATYAHRLSA